VSNEIITPDWPAPSHIKAYSTTRDLATTGQSTQEYKSFNLAFHVGDNKEHVARNRELLATHLELPNEPIWLNQVHGTNLVDIDNAQISANPAEADGSYTCSTNKVCVVMTADCLPILFTDAQGSHVAAIHAGWRSLASGIIETLLKRWPTPHNEVMAWLGPAIGPAAFEVGSDVQQAFIAHDSEAKSAFQPIQNDKWLANLVLLAKQRLKSSGVSHIYGGDYCTYADQSRFYSYRRDGQTGRMASLIWKASSWSLSENSDRHESKPD